MKHIGISYQQAKLHDARDAIVIGSGIGGVVTASAILGVGLMNQFLTWKRKR
jgi:hypothetical protein